MATHSKIGMFKLKLFVSTSTTVDSILGPQPTTFQQTTLFPKWYVAMQTEFDALQKNKTWILVSPFSLCSHWLEMGT